MSWDTLAWRQADANNPEGIAPILSEKDLLKSALDEAVSALYMGTIQITNVEVADLPSAADLPMDFMAVATFELLGKERTVLKVALDPNGGTQLNGALVDAGELGWPLAEALDQAVEAIAGEGLQAQMDMDATLPVGEPLVLFRVTFADTDGGSVGLCLATLAEVPSDLAMHLILVKEMGKIQLEPPKPKVTQPAAAAQPAPAPGPAQAPAPEATPGATPGYPGMPGYPGAAYPGMPGATPGYPGMPGYPGAAYPGMPGAMPGYPGAAYPGMPAGPGGYPGMPIVPGYPGPAAAVPNGGYPSNVRPLTLEDLAASGGSGGGSSAMDLLFGVSLEVTVEIGRTRMSIRDVLALGPGSLVPLDKLASEKVDVLVNGHQIATGEVVVVEDNFGVRITEVSSRARRLAMGEGVA